MVEVFKTNINSKRIANKLLKELKRHFPSDKINFDLEDCDRILRIENEFNPIDILKYKDICSEWGFQIEILDD